MNSNWIVASLLTLSLVGCGDKEGTGSSGSASSTTTSTSGGTPKPTTASSGHAETKPAKDPNAIDDADVDALLASKDRACECKDKACAEPEFAKYGAIVKRVGGGKLTEAQAARLKGSFRAAGVCFVKAGIPADVVKSVGD